MTMYKVIEDTYLGGRRLGPTRGKASVVDLDFGDGEVPGVLVEMSTEEVANHRATLEDEVPTMSAGTGDSQPAAQPDSDSDPERSGDQRERSGRDLSILDAIGQLSHADDGHWTKTGKPSASAVSALMAKAGVADHVSAAEIQSLAPDLRRSQ